MLYFSIQAPHNDLFYLPDDHPDWQLINSRFSYIELPDDHRVIESYKRFYEYVATGNAFMSKSMVHESKMKQYMYASMYASYYFFFKTKRLEQNEFFCANPDLDMARAIWNLLESPVLKKVLGVSLPKVEINKKIFIPKLDNP
jgi:hypothetical protein